MQQVLPENIKTKLIRFLSEIEVERFSNDWKAIQVAIAMITTPSSFRKGVHVYLHTNGGGVEESAFDKEEVSLKIWPNKIQMRHSHRVWSSWEGYTTNFCDRYIFPSEKYGPYHLDRLLSRLGSISCDTFINDQSLECMTLMRSWYNFKIETNMK